jgi:hypothetical protein
MVARCIAVGLMLAVGAGAQRQNPPGEDEEKRLPNGKLQSDELLKRDHAQNLKDMEQMRKLMEDVEADLKKNDRHVLSLKALKDLEEIEKLSRRVRGRMKRF